MNKINIVNSESIIERVTSNIISGLYDYLENETINLSSHNLIGRLQSTYAYRHAYDYLRNNFNRLNIDVTDNYYIYFVDKLVESEIMTKLVNVLYPSQHYNGVIETIELNNSGTASQLGFKQIFYQNTDITSFDELSKLINVKSLAYREFRDCSNLVSIDLSNIEYLGEESFRSAYNLSYFNGISNDQYTLRLPKCKANGIAQSNIFYHWEDKNVSPYEYPGPQIKYIVDLGDAETIGNGFCYQNKILESIDDSVLEKIKTIKGSAFYRCVNLSQDLKLPICTTIETSAFKESGVIKISELGSNCIINNQAFQDCKSLIEISDEALENISKLGTDVFNGCNNLVIEDLKLPSLTSIDTGAFKNCNVKTISDLGNITTVNGFEGNTNLTSIILPLICNRLGNSAFKGCTNLIIPDLTNIIYFNSECLRDCPNMPELLNLPQITTIHYKAFINTPVLTIYMPNLQHTNGNANNEVPSSCRGDNVFRCGNSMYIIYLKNIQKINGFFLGGGNPYCGSIYTIKGADINSNGLYHTVNGTKLYEYKGEPIFSDGTGGDPWAASSYYANAKYLVINNITPPDYWQSFGASWSDMYNGSLSLYQRRIKNNVIETETFTYLCVPRSAISTYKQWDALNPTYVNVPTEDFKTKFAALTDFDVDTRIIAIESMGHFATKAQYDAAPELPDGVHNKREYLIEEYMGLQPGEYINWDNTPTWSI